MIELPRRVYYLSQLEWAQRHSCFVVGVALQEIGEAELEWERAVQKLDLETKHITAAGPVASKWEPCFDALREGARPCMRDCMRDCMRNGSRASKRCERVRALATTRGCAPRACVRRAALRGCALCHVCTVPPVYETDGREDSHCAALPWPLAPSPQSGDSQRWRCAPFRLRAIGGRRRRRSHSSRTMRNCRHGVPPRRQPPRRQPPRRALPRRRSARTRTVATAR